MSASETKTPTPAEVARREQIVRGTIEAVNELGYHGASLAEIARRAGVAKSAILYYFGSREKLLYSVIDQIFTVFDQRIETAVAAADGPEARLTAYAESYVRHVDDHRREMTAGVEVVMSHRDESGTPLYLLSSDEDTRLLREIIAEGVASGVFRPMSAETGAALVNGILDLAVFELQRDADADLTALTKEFVPFILRGLGAGDEGR